MVTPVKVTCHVAPVWLVASLVTVANAAFKNARLLQLLLWYHMLARGNMIIMMHHRLCHASLHQLTSFHCFALFALKFLGHYENFKARISAELFGNAHGSDKPSLRLFSTAKRSPWWVPLTWVLSLRAIQVWTHNEIHKLIKAILE